MSETSVIFIANEVSSPTTMFSGFGEIVTSDGGGPINSISPFKDSSPDIDVPLESNTINEDI